MMVSGYEQHVVSVRVVQLQIGRKCVHPQIRKALSHTLMSKELKVHTRTHKSEPPPFESFGPISHQLPDVGFPPVPALFCIQMISMKRHFQRTKRSSNTTATSPYIHKPHFMSSMTSKGSSMS